MRARMMALAVLCAACTVWSGCSVQTVGAPCEDDLQCPEGQQCGPEGTCLAGARSAEGYAEACSTMMGALARHTANECIGGAPEAFLVGLDADALCASMSRSVAEGKQRFVPEKFGQCVRNLRTAACADVTLEALTKGSLLDLCGAFEPQVAGAGACNNSADCTTGWCSTSGTCPGVCKPFVRAGAACTASDACEAGTSCVGGTCLALANVGQPCSTFGVQCAADAYCGPDNTCLARKTSGTCADLKECAPTYACARVSPQGGAGSPRECRPAAKLGDACTPGRFECGVLLYCDAGSNTCQMWPEAGQACGDVNKSGEFVLCLGAQCGLTSILTLACQPYAAPGASCGSDYNCGPTGACRNGVCTPTWCHQR
jgi:hypothetical protein